MHVYNSIVSTYLAAPTEGIRDEVAELLAAVPENCPGPEVVIRVPFIPAAV